MDGRARVFRILAVIYRELIVMRIRLLLSCCLALVAPQFAFADLPFPKDAFGKIESVLKFCAKADPKSAPLFEARDKMLVNDVPEKSLAEARASSEYRDAYDAASDSLDKATKEEAAKTCSGFLVTSR
jgi:hypothetical protein